MLENLQDNNIVENKCGTLLANTGDLAYMGEPLIIVTASSMLDVGRGPGSVSGICINYSSIKWTVLGHFLMPNFTPKILTHKILTPNTRA